MTYGNIKYGYICRVKKATSCVMFAQYIEIYPYPSGKKVGKKLKEKENEIEENL